MNGRKALLESFTLWFIVCLVGVSCMSASAAEPVLNDPQNHVTVTYLPTTPNVTIIAVIPKGWTIQIEV